MCKVPIANVKTKKGPNLAQVKSNFVDSLPAWLYTLTIKFFFSKPLVLIYIVIYYSQLFDNDLVIQQ